MTQGSLRMQILEMIENGKITADEGVRLLKALAGESKAAERETLTA